MKLFAALFATFIPLFVFSQLTYTYNAGENKHYVYNDGALLAIYNNSGNTFTTFMYKGKNVLGGFSSGTPGTNVGGPVKGHSTDYPYGWIDGGGNKPIWEGFWTGFAYMDTRTNMWEGVAGNPFAQQSFSITQICPKLLDMHSVMIVGPQGNPLFQCDVHYYISPAGIGVYNKTTLLRYIQPVGYDDTGGQFMMSQVDCDLDPSKSYDSINQTDLYFKLACDAHTENINPFSPYNNITPSNIYADQNITSPPGNVVHPLPNTALVSTSHSFSI
ncbi:MAG: hypothetical protein PHD97_13215, partial [Bacteroidales bacterium]|nr:hypothetical protein [Bacteroidales bacterium]